MERPDKVTIAINLLWASLAIGIPRCVLEFSNFALQEPVSFIIVVQLFTFSIMGLLIYIIGTGKNWARITFLVLVIVGLPFYISPLLQSLQVNLISGILGIAQFIMQIIAVVFLFYKQSSTWFTHKPA